MRRSVILSILVGLLLGAGPYARAIAETWRIACDAEFPPYNFIENGQVVGIDADIVTALVQQAGAAVRFEPQPWNRVQDLLERGEVDAAFQFVGRPDRFEKYFMIGPYRIGQTVFAARSDATIQMRGLEDLRGFRIGTIRGYTYGAAFDNATAFTKDAGAGDNGQLVRMLAAGRVDLIIGDRATLLHFARRDALQDRLHILQPPFAEVPRYIAVPRTRPQVAVRLEQALLEWRRSGGLEAVLRRWE
jgi:polar amino acid transport system substrate-binding protein